MERRTASPDETRRLAAALAHVMEPGALVALDGDLGAGKTTFVQGFAEALESREPASSPTFVLLRVYQGRLPIYHFDAYRLEGAHELDDIGADEYFWGDGVSLVEWAERIEEALPPDRLHVRIEQLGPEERRLTVDATGPRHRAMLEKFQA